MCPASVMECGYFETDEILIICKNIATNLTSGESGTYSVHDFHHTIQIDFIVLNTVNVKWRNMLRLVGCGHP
jgi:hypothetical protein